MVYLSEGYERLREKMELRQRLKALADTVVGKEVNLTLRSEHGGSSDGKGSITVNDPYVLTTAGFTKDEAIASALVTTVHEGAHIRFKSDSELLRRYLEKLAKKGEDEKHVYLVLDMAEDLRIDAAMAKERPGYGEQHELMAHAWVKRYKPDGDPKMDAIRAAAARLFAGVDLLENKEWSHVDPTVVDKLVTILERAREAESCAEALKIGHKAYRKAFGWTKKEEEDHEDSAVDSGQDHDDSGAGGGDSSAHHGSHADNSECPSGENRGTSEGSGEADGEDDPGVGSDDRDVSGAEDEADEDGDGDDEAESDGAEGGDGEDGDNKEGDEEVDSKYSGFGKEHILTGIIPDETKEKIERSKEKVSEEEALKEIRRQDTNKFLAGSYKVEKPKELQDAEAYAARDLHSGCEAYYLKDGDNVMRNMYSNYYRSIVVTARMKTIREALARALKDELRKSRDQSSLLSKTGYKVHPSKVWKATHLNRQDVMVKKVNTSPGGWHVDVWIDSSGSMTLSTRDAREMLWILIGALRDAGMSVRAFSWFCDGHWTLIKKLHEAGDTLEEQVNQYEPEGDNRDGFVLRIAHHMLKQVQAPYKLLVWISDGLPANTAYLAGEFGGEVSYVFDRNPKVRVDMVTQVRMIKKDTSMVAFLLDHGYTNQKENARMIYGREFIHVDLNKEDGMLYIPNAVKLYLTRLMMEQRG